MMGVGSMGAGAGAGAGGNTSSTSNLSASAPPFKVDRANPMLSSKPVFHFPEMSYPAESFDQTAQFSRPSAPAHEMDFNFISSGMAITSFNDYQNSTSMSARPPGSYWSAPTAPVNTSGSNFVYGGEINTYYSPSVPMIGEDNPLMENDGHYRVMPSSLISAPEQLDESQWFDNIGPDDSKWIKPQWFADMGPNDGKWIKSGEHVGSFSSKNVNAGVSHSYDCKVSQGTRRDDIECGIKSLEISGVPYGNLSRLSGSEVFLDQALGMTNCKNNSYPEQNVDLPRYDDTRVCFSSSSSLFPGSHYFGQSRDMVQNTSLPHNVFHPFDDCVMPVDSSFSSIVSATRSSSSVVIRPPSSVNNHFGKNDTSYELKESVNAAVVQYVSLDCDGSSKHKYSDLKSNLDVKEDSPQFASEEKFLNTLHTSDTCIPKSKAYGNILPDLDVPNVFATAGDTIPVFYSADDSSDFVDHYNPAVDSPCWKGALSSQFLAFDSGSGNSFKKNLSEGFDHEESQNLLPFNCPTRVFPGIIGACDENNDCDDRNGVLMSDSTLDVHSRSKEPISSDSDDTKASVGISTMCNGDRVLICNQADTLTNKSCFQNQLMGSLDVNIFNTENFNVEEDPTIPSNDTSEGGIVAFHAAEKVLSSPSALEVDTEFSKLLPDAKFDVQAMMEFMHTISEMVRDYLSSDVCAAEETNSEILKDIINNLNACMRKNIDNASAKMKSNSYVRDTSEKLGTPQNVTTTTFKLHKENVATGEYVKREYQNLHGESRSSISSSYKSSNFSPFNLTRDDATAKAIEKVLRENFHCDEEMCPQALLFKNLWLEAEAKLCSINYIARFDRMKIEMGNFDQANIRKESKDVAELKSKGAISLDESLLSSNVHCVASLQPDVGNTFVSSATEHSSFIGSSIMDRLNILKSLDDNHKLTLTEGEKESKMVEGENAGSIEARFNILSSQENNLTSTDVEKNQQPQIVDGAHAESIVARFNILKARKDYRASTSLEKGEPEMLQGQNLEPRPIGVNILRPMEGSSGLLTKEELKSTVGGERAPKEHQQPFTRNKSNVEVFNVSPNQHFSHHSGILDGKYGYLHHSVANDSLMASYSGGSHDSSSCLDWEHIQKNDYAWKDL